jgi:hypothetical protein
MTRSIIRRRNGETDEQVEIEFRKKVSIWVSLGTSFRRTQERVVSRQWYHKPWMNYLGSGTTVTEKARRINPSCPCSISGKAPASCRLYNKVKMYTGKGPQSVLPLLVVV